MNIQAITPVSVCQPVNRVDFAKKAKKTEAVTVPAKESPEKLAAKYDTACCLAAYYKTQYENLLKNGCCEA
ncbi:hypothetical protein II906_04355 [bacterium]|nr:hypothetical protein [bacterium]